MPNRTIHLNADSGVTKIEVPGGILEIACSYHQTEIALRRSPDFLSMEVHSDLPPDGRGAYIKFQREK